MLFNFSENVTKMDRFLFSSTYLRMMMLRTTREMIGRRMLRIVLSQRT